LLTSEDLKIKNKAESALWFLKASEKGIPSASFMLAQMCFRGEGVKKDINEALRHAHDALAQGFSPKAMRPVLAKIHSTLEKSEDTEEKEKQTRLQIIAVQQRLEELKALQEVMEDDQAVSVYKVSPEFRFSIRSEPTEDPKKVTGRILAPGTLFKVKSVHRKKVSFDAFWDPPS